MNKTFDYNWGHDDPEYDVVYAEESLLGDVSELIALVRARCHLPQTRVVTQYMTIREFAAVCHELNFDVHLALVDRKTGERLTLGDQSG